MSCCVNTSPEKSPDAIDRRSVVKGIGASALGLILGGSGFSLAARPARIRLAFCSQLLCVVPYEFTRSQGFFADEGLDVELIYTRGGGAAMQALVGGAVEYAATSLDAALQAYANGAQVRRFATTGRLPLFALAVGPRTVGEITGVEELIGRTVGVSALGNADHVLMLYLLERTGIDPDRVSFATLGVNLYDALRVGHVDAGWVQEPSLTLIREAGGDVLFNAMDIGQATEFLGGAYEFMGVSVRAGELAERQVQMVAIARALQNGLRAMKQTDPEEIIAGLPRELTAGSDLSQLAGILAETVDSLYPDEVRIDLTAAQRVVQSQIVAGLVDPGIDLQTLMATEVLQDLDG